MRITRSKVVGVAVLIILAAALVLALAGGCTHNLTRLSDGNVYTRTSSANIAAMSPLGNLEAAYYGIGPSQIMQDPNGNWSQQPGPLAVISVPLAGGVAYILSPNNTKIARVTYTPNPRKGEAALVVEGLDANLSEPLREQAVALGDALTVLQAMTKEEALATVEKWKAAGQMMPTIADALIKIIGMWAPVPVVP